MNNEITEADVLDNFTQFFTHDITLIDARVLLILVPASMLLMRAIMLQNLECVIYLVAIGLLSVLWITARQRNMMKG